MLNLTAILAGQRIIARDISSRFSLQVAVRDDCPVWCLIMIHAAVWILRMAGGFDNITMTEKAVGTASIIPINPPQGPKP